MCVSNLTLAEFISFTPLCVEGEHKLAVQAALDFRKVLFIKGRRAGYSVLYSEIGRFLKYKRIPLNYPY